MTNNLSALVDDDFLILYDNQTKLIKKNIPLEKIVRIDSSLYRHSIILDRQYPCVALKYQAFESPTENRLDDLTIRTISKEWNLPKILKSRIRTKTLRLFYETVEPVLISAQFQKGCNELFALARNNPRDSFILSDTCAELLQGLISHTVLDRSAKSTLLNTNIIDLVIDEIEKTFKLLDKQSSSLQNHNSITKWAIIRKSGKEIGKMIPQLKSSIHPQTLLNSLDFLSLCVDWITCGLFDNPSSNIKIPRLDLNSNHESGNSFLDLVNDLSNELLKYESNYQMLDSFKKCCISICSLASEVVSISFGKCIFSQPNFLMNLTISHIFYWLIDPTDCDESLVHAFRHTHLLYYLLITHQITNLKLTAEYKYLAICDYISIEKNDKRKTRLISIILEILKDISLN